MVTLTIQPVFYDKADLGFVGETIVRYFLGTIDDYVIKDNIEPSDVLIMSEGLEADLGFESPTLKHPNGWDVYANRLLKYLSQFGEPLASNIGSPL